MNYLEAEKLSNAAKIAGYREALRICAVSTDRGGVSLQNLMNEFEEMEKAYHYAQRYIGLYTPADTEEKPEQKARILASHKLAFKMVFDLFDSGVEGLGYSGSDLKYVVFPGGAAWADDAFRTDYRKTYGVTQEFGWRWDPWQLLRVGEKMTGSIGRVKAKTAEDVKARLFMPLEAKHVNNAGSL
jgi:hypothetical protein